MKKLVMLLVILPVFVGVAQAGEAERRILLGVYAQTHRCFKEATLAVRVAGISAPDKVTEATTAICGGPLRDFLSRDAKMPSHDIERLLYIFAYDYYLQLQRLL